MIVAFKLHFFQPPNRLSSLFFIPCDYFGLDTGLKVRFVDILTRGDFSIQTPTAHSALIFECKLWDIRAPDYIDDVFVRGHG